MPKFKVTVKFDRVGTQGEIEKSEREDVFESRDRNTAKKEFLRRFKDNEPNRRRIGRVTVEQME